MYTIIIFAIIGIFVILKELDAYSFLEIIFIGFLGSLLGGFVGLLISIALPMKTYDKKSKVELVSLQDNSTINGRFFLGSGQINEGMGYVFYYKSDNNTFKLATYKSDLVSIKYTANKPVAHITSNEPDMDSWVNLFAVDLDLGVKDVVVEIPEGSINNEYKLDAQ